MAEFEELTGGVDAWSMLLGSLSMVTIFAALLTWPVCALLLALYRRSVSAGMRRGARAGGQASARAARPAFATPPCRRIGMTAVAGGQDHPLLRRARRRALRAQVTFCVAGLLFGLTSTAVHTVVEDLPWSPWRTLTLALLLSCLVVPSVIAQGVTSRRAQVALYAGYLVLVVGLPVLGGTSATEALVLAAIVVALPYVLVLATGVPALRGAAWLVAPALMIVGFAALMLFPVVLSLWLGVPLSPLMWGLLAGAACLLAAGAAYGWAVATLYARKWTSDQTLLVLQWWVVLDLVQLQLLATQGARAAALALCPFAVLVLVLLGATALRREDVDPPVRLLLLRTFGARRRTSRLLRGVTAQWRWIGSVELITATDVATEVLEPHEFLDFLRRRTAEHFVADVDQVARRVAELDVRPDRDGRFRVNDLLCHGDTWQPTVQLLLREVDAVLVDLRGLTGGNAGVLHEIECLVASVPLERVVALVDASTDARVLQQALDRAATTAPPSAPLHDDERPALQVVPLTGRRDDVGRVLAAAAQAAGRASRGGGTPPVVPQDRAPRDDSRAPGARPLSPHAAP